MRPILFAACLFAAPTVAAFAQTPPTPAPAPAPAPDAKKVCRQFGTTGTILGGRKVCRTKAEWAAYDRGQEESRNRNGMTKNTGLGPRTD